MSEALTIRDDAERVLLAINSDSPPSLEQFAAELGLSVHEAAGILTSKDVEKSLQDVTQARARLALHGVGISRLVSIVETGEVRDALSALSIIGKLAGDFKPQPLRVHHTFDGLRAQASQVDAGPLGGITQITEGAIIDVAEEDGE